VGARAGEINLVYAEALEMADRTVLYKHGAKEIATCRGCSLTFMAKYDMGAAGSSFHLHSSLWDKAGRKPLFPTNGKGPGPQAAAAPLFGHWLAGQMAMARELAYFYAPGVNSYKRYQSGSFAPTRVAAGWDNRTCGFRLCGEGASFRWRTAFRRRANPYLAFAATIVAGLHGVTSQSLKTPKPLRGQRLPGRHAAAGAQDAARGHRRARALQGRARRPRRSRDRSLSPHGAARATGLRPGCDGLGADPELRAYLTANEKGPDARPD